MWVPDLNMATPAPTPYPLFWLASVSEYLNCARLLIIFCKKGYRFCGVMPIFIFHVTINQCFLFCATFGELVKFKMNEWMYVCIMYVYVRMYVHVCMCILCMYVLCMCVYTLKNLRVSDYNNSKLRHHKTPETAAHSQPDITIRHVISNYRHPNTWGNFQPQTSQYGM
jgi:hypothetical protein